MKSTYYNHYWIKESHGARRAGYFEPMLHWMDENLKSDNRPIKALEAGCGNGAFTSALRSYCIELSACDIASDQIAQNKKTFKDINFFQQDLQERIPFEDNYFDFIWCSEVLEHLYFPLIALKEFRRILKPNGKILITVPFHGRFKCVLIALFKWDHHFDPEYPHVRFFSKQSLQDLVVKAGFIVQEVKSCGMQKPLRDILIPTNILLTATAK